MAANMLVVHRASVSEQPAGLLVLYQHMEPRDRQRQISETLMSVTRGEFSLEGLFLAWNGNRCVGALLGVLQLDSSVYVFPPVVLAEQGARIAEELLTCFMEWIGQQPVVLAQALTEIEDSECHQVWEWAGWRHVADLEFLSHPLKQLEEPRWPVPKTLLPFAESLRPIFARTIERTFVDSQDCPELTRHRTGEETMLSQQRAGSFEPRLWWMVCVGDEIVGLCLLNSHPNLQQYEIGYLGVVPEYRHRGWGKAILAKALQRAQIDGQQALFVAVDVANQDARQLYRSAGFQAVRRQRVHMWFATDTRIPN